MLGSGIIDGELPGVSRHEGDGGVDMMVELASESSRLT